MWVGGNAHHAGSSLRPAGLVEIVPILNELAEFLVLADFFYLATIQNPQVKDL